MTRNPRPHPRPPGHLRVAAATIGALSMMLAGGLHWLGFLERANAQLAHLVAQDGTGNFPQQLPDACVWLAAAGFALGLAAAILATPGHLRRLILWLSTLAIIAAWAPVLSLAAYAPDIAAPWIATLWSGFCALYYAAHHRMACESPTPRP